MNRRIAQSGVVAGALGLAVVASCAVWFLFGDSSTRARPVLTEVAHAAPADSAADPIMSSLELVTQDPLAFLHEARRAYDLKVRDYVCTFTKREYLGGRMRPEQQAAVKYREGPRSVFMHFTKNADKARRVFYVQDRIVKDGEQYAVIEPEGAIARIFVSTVERPIEGKEARKAARRSIAHFGFSGSLDLIIRYSEFSREMGKLDLRYAGEGQIAGRPTFVIERRLHGDGPPDAPWPDTLLVAHIDQEWLIPVGVYAYGDLEGKELLGKYTYTNVVFNVGLSDRDFDPDSYGL